MCMTKMRKLPGILSALCLVSLLFLPVTVSAKESSQTTLTTKVPETHEVSLVIEGNGTVKDDSGEYRKSQRISVPRLTRQKYQIVADDGWTIKKVSYGIGDNIREIVLNGNAFTAPELNADGNMLYVVFEKKTSTDIEGDTTKGDSVQTGDSTNLWLLGMLLAGSGMSLYALHKREQKVN